jgi:hypothetical protein
MLPQLMCASLALALLGAPARAEQDSDHHQKAIPDLRIRLVVVPAVFPPHHKDRDHDGDDVAVNYKFPISAEQFSVSEEMRSMPVDGIRQEQVQLKTIVLK